MYYLWENIILNTTICRKPLKRRRKKRKEEEQNFIFFKSKTEACKKPYLCFGVGLFCLWVTFLMFFSRPGVTGAVLQTALSFND